MALAGFRFSELGDQFPATTIQVLGDRAALCVQTKTAFALPLGANAIIGNEFPVMFHKSLRGFKRLLRTSQAFVKGKSDQKRSTGSGRAGSPVIGLASGHHVLTRPSSASPAGVGCPLGGYVGIESRWDSGTSYCHLSLSTRRIAAVLNERGVKTSRGGKWQSMKVGRLLDRLGLAESSDPGLGRVVARGG